MKLITVIGARPQIIKAAAISRVLRLNYPAQIDEVIIHTGQHYDEYMSAIFFKELGIAQPDYNLNVRSGNHGEQTAKMLTGIEEILIKESADALLVYGDTNSTVSGSLAASKIGIPIIHIEAGLRSFNKRMPEEINRIMCDHASTLLFSPTKQGVENLKNEGFELNNDGPFDCNNPNVYHCGDIMYDNAIHFAKLLEGKNTILDRLQLNHKYILATVHRDNNTDDLERLSAIFESLIDLIEKDDLEIIIPLHPRTKEALSRIKDSTLNNKIQSTKKLRLIPPVSYMEMLALEKNAHLIITDSGGVQKEAFFFQKPCLILRAETEWVEIVENGNALLCDAQKEKIIEGYKVLSSKQNYTYPNLFGDGKAAEFICEEILRQLT